MYTLALSHGSDKEKLLKEVTTMLSFTHPNVMSLIGVCFDDEVPLIIMPYMSKGSVLGYVKENKEELYFDSQANQEQVLGSQSLLTQYYVRKHIIHDKLHRYTVNLYSELSV